MTKDWPWNQEPNCAVITERAIIENGKPILFVSHDLDDDGWQFLAGGEPTVENAKLVSLRSIAERDPSVVQLASMAPGHVAARETANSPWVIKKNPRTEEDEDAELDAQASEDDIIVPNFRFKCPKCEEIHDGFPAYTYDAPDYCLSIPETERAKRCEKTDDFCTVDHEHYFVRCVLEYPIIGTSEVMSWGVWGSLSKKNFELYRKIFKMEQRDEFGPFFSWLSNELPSEEYPDCRSVKCTMHIQNNGQRPTLTVQSEDHPLYNEQKNGIAFAKALRIVKPFITWHSAE